jgi:nitrate reductase delta subunit
VTDLGTVARLLLYPEEPFEEAAPVAADRHVAAFLEAARGVPLERLRDDYIATFDFDKRTNLYLTYHLYGDGRRRGIELVRLKRRFREAGLELDDGELPDFLPVLLEFAELDAVAAALPALTRRQAAAVERLAVEGPPTELVGLDSFTPPELEPFLTGRSPA